MSINSFFNPLFANISIVNSLILIIQLAWNPQKYRYLLGIISNLERTTAEKVTVSAPEIETEKLPIHRSTENLSNSRISESQSFRANSSPKVNLETEQPKLLELKNYN